MRSASEPIAEGAARIMQMGRGGKRSGDVGVGAGVQASQPLPSLHCSKSNQTLYHIKS